MEVPGTRAIPNHDARECCSLHSQRCAVQEWRRVAGRAVALCLLLHDWNSDCEALESIAGRLLGLPRWASSLLLVGLSRCSVVGGGVMPTSANPSTPWVLSSPGICGGFGCSPAARDAPGGSRIPTVPGNPSRKRLGRISYSLYLVHLVVLLEFSPRWSRGLNALGMTNPATVTPRRRGECPRVVLFRGHALHWVVEGRPAPPFRAGSTSRGSRIRWELVVKDLPDGDPGRSF